MKLKKIFTSIVIIILVFFILFHSKVEANFFEDDSNTEIEKIIDEDERRTF